MVRRKTAAPAPIVEAAPEIVEEDAPQESPKSEAPPGEEVAELEPSSPVTAPGSPPTPLEPEAEPAPEAVDVEPASEPEPDLTVGVDPEATPDDAVGQPEISVDQLAALDFIDKLPRGYGQCEYVEDEPNRNSNRVPFRPVNSATFYRKQCPRAAKLRLRSQSFTGTRSGFYCLKHTLEEIARSSVEQARLDRALSTSAVTE